MDNLGYYIHLTSGFEISNLCTDCGLPFGNAFYCSIVRDMRCRWIVGTPDNSPI